MQRCNERMGINIHRMFNSYYIPRRAGFGYTCENSIENGNVYQDFVRVDVRDRQNMKIPLFLIGMPGLIEALDKSEIGELVFPMCYTKTISSYRTQLRSADAIVKNFVFMSSTSSQLVSRVDTNKGDVYYGCAGLIMNSDKKPLFMPIMECNIIGGILYISECIVYVHPLVFYCEGIMEKCIANKILPYILSHRINSYIDTRNNIDKTSIESPTIHKVVVDNSIEEYFYSTPIPNDVPSKEEIDHLLLNHLNEIV